MKKKYVLRKNDDVVKTMSYKNIYKTKEFVIYVHKNDYPNGRVCISVSKKLGNAVVRNKIKRQVRDMVRRVFDLNICKDYVIIIKPDFLLNDFSYNLEMINKLYLKINSLEE